LREIIKSEVKKYADEVYTDNMGNLVCRKKGEGDKIMLSANMDEIGFIAMVTDDKPFVKVKNIGDVKINCLQNAVIEFSGGRRGILYCEGDKPTSIDDFYVDMLGDTGITTGDAATFVPNFYINGDLICSKALGSRVGCYILVDIIKNAKKTDKDLYFVFTTQKELRNSGAKTAAYDIKPNYAINIGTALCSNVPGGNELIKLGGGPAIKIIDSSGICHPYIKDILADAAKTADIPFQFEVSSKGKSDTGAVMTSGSGIICGSLSIPVRYHHSPTEVVSISDVDNAVMILHKTYT